MFLAFGAVLGFELWALVGLGLGLGWFRWFRWFGLGLVWGWFGFGFGLGVLQR